MADLTPEENERLMAQNEGIIFDEAARFAETDGLDDLPYATVETIDTLLTEDQRRRVEALLEAHNLLVTDTAINNGGLAGALIGASTKEEPLVASDTFATDLMSLAAFILEPSTIQPTFVHTGDARTSEVRVHGDPLGGVIVMPGEPFPTANVEPVSLEVREDPSCQCTRGGGIGGRIAVDSEGLTPFEFGYRFKRALRNEFGARVIDDPENNDNPEEG